MLLDSRLRPCYSPARVNRVLVTNGRIGTRQSCMGLSHMHNEYPYQQYEQQNQGFMTGLKSYSVQTIYVTAVNVLRLELLVYSICKSVLSWSINKHQSCRPACYSVWQRSLYLSLDENMVCLTLMYLLCT